MEPNGTRPLTTEVFYDIETQRSADEVGGWGNIHLMLVSVAVSWSEEDGYRHWDESATPGLIEYLSRYDRIISFNGDGFDSRVLSHYGDNAVIMKRSFDVLTDLKRRLGHRLSLDSIAQATLGMGKSADGLQAIRWWKEGRTDLIAEYCQRDVEVLMKIVGFGRNKGFVKYQDKFGTEKTVPVEW
ncbi:MAG: ribonuclease H-like domain-containing protein [Bacteroidota bacterium]